MQLMPVHQPTTLPEMIQYKMVKRRLKQKDLAILLEISAARLSEILSGKRRITIDVAKKLYERLQVSLGFILK
ncbi:helix-turn-helix domain-containing protein [Runella aurantiaca]|uniref:XRE family transcriptional regulator n=1 Tax=Runella aurantiaca TaxID=2282308 RepID=A0A369HXS7_9BACT|nr:helix-turn-helix transcriptional regulator [Runella aurantiaca]RDB02331.1 XRE family transcriptional regulator [Runella aurantiaca]